MVWGLILNLILPLLPSFWGFTFALGRRVSPHSRSSAALENNMLRAGAESRQHSPANGVFAGILWEEKEPTGDLDLISLSHLKGEQPPCRERLLLKSPETPGHVTTYDMTC